MANVLIKDVTPALVANRDDKIPVSNGTDLPAVITPQQIVDLAVAYQPDEPLNPADGMVWIDSDEVNPTTSPEWADIQNKPAFGTAATSDADDFAPALHNHDSDYAPVAHNHDADYEAAGAVAGHESAFDHTQLHAPGSDDQDLSGYSLTTHDHDANYEAAGAVGAHELSFDHSLLHAPGSDDQTDITGNAATATKLQTARTINGVLFDGTEDITLPAASPTTYSITQPTNSTTFNLTGLSIADGEEYSLYMLIKPVAPATEFWMYFNSTANKYMGGTAQFTGAGVSVSVAFPVFFENPTTTDDIIFLGTVRMEGGYIIVSGHYVVKGGSEKFGTFCSHSQGTVESMTALNIQTPSGSIAAGSVLKLTKRY